MKYTLTNLICVASVIMLAACSLGGDLDEWADKAIEANTVSFTVTFNSNGGSAVPAQKVRSGDIVARPANPTWSGYTFDTWYSDPALNTAYNFNAPVTGNITLYAGWEGIPPGSFVVRFESNEGSSIDDQIVSSGSTAERPIDPTRRGYVFDNWYIDSELYTAYNFNTPVTAHITLYAKWEWAFVVTFESNGGSSIDDQNISPGSIAERPIDPTREGYAFDNWYIDSGLNMVYDFSTPVTGNITLYAKWNDAAYPGDITIIPPDVLEDETISGFTASISISKTGAGYASSHIIQVAAGYSSYEWYVDSLSKSADAGSEGRSFTIQAANYSVGRHTVTVIVTKGDKPYSNTQSITVVD